MRSADSQHQQHRVQSHEARGPAAAVSQPRCRAPDQRHRRQAGDNGERFERPQPTRQPQRRGRVARQREQRAIWRALKRPADKRIDLVGRGFGREMRVRVQTMQRTQARKRQVAKHVLRDQRRPQQQRHVREHDRTRHRCHRQRPCAQQYERVAGAHDQHQRLEAAAAHAHAQAMQRAREPSRPAALARGHVLRGLRRRPRTDQQHGRDDAQQTKRAERPRHARG